MALPLRTLTLHGMIGGSTGTGKAIQVLAEQLSEAGAPVFLADLKGDMEGFVRPNESEKVAEGPGSSALDTSRNHSPLSIRYPGISSCSG